MLSKSTKKEFRDKVTEWDNAHQVNFKQYQHMQSLASASQVITQQLEAQLKKLGEAIADHNRADNVVPLLRTIEQYLLDKHPIIKHTPMVAEWGLTMYDSITSLLNNDEITQQELTTHLTQWETLQKASITAYEDYDAQQSDILTTLTNCGRFLAALRKVKTANEAITHLTNLSQYLLTNQEKIEGRKRLSGWKDTVLRDITPLLKKLENIAKANPSPVKELPKAHNAHPHSRTTPSRPRSNRSHRAHETPRHPAPPAKELPTENIPSHNSPNGHHEAHTAHPYSRTTPSHHRPTRANRAPKTSRHSAPPAKELPTENASICSTVYPEDSASNVGNRTPHHSHDSRRSAPPIQDPNHGIAADHTPENPASYGIRPQDHTTGFFASPQPFDAYQHATPSNSNRCDSQPRAQSYAPKPISLLESLVMPNNLSWKKYPNAQEWYSTILTGRTIELEQGNYRKEYAYIYSMHPDMSIHPGSSTYPTYRLRFFIPKIPEDPFSGDYHCISEAYDYIANNGYLFYKPPSYTHNSFTAHGFQPQPPAQEYHSPSSYPPHY